MPKTKDKPMEIVIQPRRGQVALQVAFVGDMPLITANKDHACQIISGEIPKPKEDPTPEDQYEWSKYRMPDGTDAFPSMAFVRASVMPAKFIKGLTKVDAGMALQIWGPPEKPEYLPLTYDSVEMRRDAVSNSMKGLAIAYRAEYVGWRCRGILMITESLFKGSIDQAINLVNDGGSICGVGSMRGAGIPKPGPYGRYHLEVCDD